MDPFKNNPDLLSGFQEGDVGALEEVYKAFEPSLRTFVLRGFVFRSAGRQLHFSGFRGHDLEDIIQETFRRAFTRRARNAFDGVRPYKNYLFTIARNLVIMELTARQRQIPMGEALVFDASPEDTLALLCERQQSTQDEPQSTESQVENLEIFGLIMGFVEGLVEQERRFFRHRFLERCSQEKTAAHMGWNRPQVRLLETRLRRAFLCHMSGAGYLETRRESKKVRRTEDPAGRAKSFARSRVIWRERRAEQTNEFLYEAV